MFFLTIKEREEGEGGTSTGVEKRLFQYVVTNGNTLTEPEPLFGEKSSGRSNF